MSLTKMFKKLTGNHMILTTVLVSVALIYFLNNYSSAKSVVSEGNSAPQAHQVASGALSAPPSGCSNNYKPSEPVGQNSGYVQVSGGSSANVVPGSKQASVDPAELLPKGSHNEFSQMNPGNAADITSISLLKAGHHIGINTVGNSLRNPNLQIRAEPANPQVKVSPWMNTTIEPDLLRKPLEASCRN